MSARFSLILAFATLVGCSSDLPAPANPDTNMTTEGFDKSCTADADCVLVFVGNVCGCGCTQEAISNAESARYSAEQEEKRLDCVDILSCQPCPDTRQAVCDQGTCYALAK